MADLNNDGRNDVVVSHWNASHLSVFLQQSDGTLADYISYWCPAGGYDDTAVGDLNNDGLMDFVKMNGQLDTSIDLLVYLQTEDGTLSGPTIYNLPDTTMGNRIAVGDITGDGRDDVVMSYGGNRPHAYIAVFAQTEAGILSFAATYEAYEIPGSAVITDANMDGRSDVVITHAQWERLSVYLQNDEGELDPYSLYALPYYMNHPSRALVTGDLNNDGLPDVAFAHYLGPAILYHFPIFTDRGFLPYITTYD
ncbi:MAG: VCBS repeat-containing protein [Chloroflexi bacterium]|nr:VCBS repeat-containing protein [Chloroflexota bacterium]